MLMAPILGALGRVPAPFLLVILLLRLSPGSPRPLDIEGTQAPQKCVLAGVWVNDLGSRMSISGPDAKGAFSGSYLTAVSASSQNPIQASVITGLQHPATAAGGQPTFGFTVHWTFSDSTTVFVGQCFVGADGQETLETSWLLREKVPSHAEDWKATRVGQNTFLRVK
ncbi:avidin-related protein 4/5-like [Sceloporus undulatus]|uniref:avidin-related protein 4/5-like n=1 Tax=Sceloporus undulatus TaxID=8520 RepID=UPI001C4CFC7C|nr:avidin-related protein 4/5-like [Sceloporus undulatus]